jgi:NAD(P)-dependent dehydrogenase (short-subunit alcohol dehydrogenase family)
MAAPSSSQKLAGRVAIVTGASQGIGREICLQLHSEGAYLACADLKSQGVTSDETPIHELIVQKGGKAIFVQVNVGDAKQVEALVAKTVEEYGRLDM